MAEKSITFKDKKVKKFFKQLSENVDDIEKKNKVFWGALSAVAFRDVLDHFSKEQGESGPWKKWSSIYTAHMQRIGRASNKKLQFSGQLRQNVRLADSSSRIKQGQLLFNPAQTKKGFPYAKAHDEGGRKLPKRDYMWLSDKALNQMSVIMAEHTLKGV